MRNSVAKKFFVVFSLVIMFAAGPFIGSAEAAAQVEAGKLTKVAKSLIGTRYVYGGTTTKGFDCSGFLGYVFDSVGVDLPRTSSAMYATGDKVEKKDLEPGDLVFFNTSGKGVSHVGVYIGDGKFAHASSSRGVRVDKLNDPYYWGKRYVGAKRVADTVMVASAKK